MKLVRIALEQWIKDSELHILKMDETELDLSGSRVWEILAQDNYGTQYIIRNELSCSRLPPSSNIPMDTS